MSNFRYVNDVGGEVNFSLSGGIYAVFEGISENLVTVATAQGIAQIGATAQSQAIQPREITANGILIGDSAAGKALLLSVIVPGRPARLYYGDYYVTVYPTMTPALGWDACFARFQFQLVAPYPYWVLDDELTVRMTGLDPAFKFPWNLTVPWFFGTAISASYSVVLNAGTAPSPFELVLVAADDVENPRLNNVTTGEYLLINRTLVAGETVTVTTSHGLTAVTSSVGGDIRGDLDMDSTLYRLAAGENVLTVTADSGAGNITSQITYSPELLGVAV